MSDQILKRDHGWRVGWRPQAPVYPALVGGDDWAVELTATEFAELRRLLGQLTEAITAIAPELMPEEQIDCEVEGEWLWLGAEGLPAAYGVRLILNQGRGAEGYWPPGAIAGLVAALQAEITAAIPAP